MPSVNIQKAVQNKDVFKIRSYLIADILVDKNLSGIFKEDFEYCLKNGISEDEIYEKHDDKVLSDEISKENYKILRADLNSNFSKERINALKKLGEKLYPAQNQAQQEIPHSHYNTMPPRQNDSKFAYIIGGVIALIAAGIIVLLKDKS